MKRIVWTPIIDDALITLLGKEENLTYLQVSAELEKMFGGGFTRNGCIGRAGRLKLPPRAPRPLKEIVQRAREARSKVIHMPVRIDAPIEPKEARRHINSRHLTLLQLDFGVCKYPEGDKPPYLYCGQPTDDGASFCAEHVAVCYQKPRKQWA